MNNFSVTKNGKPLNPSLYTWDEDTRTFSTKEWGLMLDFSGVNNCTFKTGYDCTFKTGSNCTFNTGYSCTFDTDFYCTFKTGYDCTFKTGSNCTFNTGYSCTFDTDFYCTFDTGDNCIFNTGYSCTFKTSYNCTFYTGSNCTFDIGYGCTFNTSYNCTFKTDTSCVILRRDTKEVLRPQKNILYKLPTYGIKGYIKNGYYYIDNKKQYRAIIADGILSEIIEQKGNVYKVRNYNCNDITYLVSDGELYSHGKTYQEAKESLIYKISNRDTSVYNNYTLDTELTKEEAIKMYRVIAGACELGTRYFCENNPTPDKLTVKELIEITKGQYNNERLEQFFSNKEIKE